MRVVLDIEANGLDPTRIWCIVAKDIKTNKVYTFEPDTISNFKDFSTNISLYIGHNLIGYDLPAIRKLLNINVPLDRIVDTLVVSRLLDSQREKHSLQYWGEQLGHEKVEHDDWDVYSVEMLHRCTEDVHLNHKIYEALLQEAKIKQTPKSVFRSEHYIAQMVEEMRIGGILLDEQKAQLLLATLRQRKKELDDELLRTFISLPVFKREVHPKLTKAGKYSRVGLKGFNSSDIGGSFSAITWPDPNLNSQQFIIKHLVNAGWKPTVFTDKGNPRLTEWVLEEAAKKFPKA